MPEKPKGLLLKTKQEKEKKKIKPCILKAFQLTHWFRGDSNKKSFWNFKYTILKDPELGKSTIRLSFVFRKFQVSFYEYQ